MDKIIEKLSSCFQKKEGNLIANFLTKEIKNGSVKKLTTSVILKKKKKKKIFKFHQSYTH